MMSRLVPGNRLRDPYLFLGRQRNSLRRTQAARTTGRD